MKTETAGEADGNRGADQAQHLSILEAIRLLQTDLDAMTSEISPETESWRDVSRYAHVAEIARSVITRYSEANE